MDIPNIASVTTGDVEVIDVKLNKFDVFFTKNRSLNCFRGPGASGTPPIEAESKIIPIVLFSARFDHGDAIFDKFFDPT